MLTLRSVSIVTISNARNGTKACFSTSIICMLSMHGYHGGIATVSIVTISNARNGTKAYFSTSTICMLSVHGYHGGITTVDVPFKPYIADLMADFGKDLSTVIKSQCITPLTFYLFKFNKRNTRKMCEVYSKLRIKIPERRHLVFLLLTLNLIHTFFWCFYCRL